MQNLACYWHLKGNGILPCTNTDLCNIFSLFGANFKWELFQLQHIPTELLHYLLLLTHTMYLIVGLEFDFKWVISDLQHDLLTLKEEVWNQQQSPWGLRPHWSSLPTIHNSLAARVDLLEKLLDIQQLQLKIMKCVHVVQNICIPKTKFLS